MAFAGEISQKPKQQQRDSELAAKTVCFGKLWHYRGHLFTGLPGKHIEDFNTNILKQ